MSRSAARPVKKPISAANTPEKQAATALDHLERGRFRDAIECYKVLVKTEQRPEWLAGLASAYAGRANALAAKNMRREAIELWRSRAEICHTPLWEGPYAGWLVAEGRISEVLGYLSRRRDAANAAPEGKADDGLAALEAQLAPGLLSADDSQGHTSRKARPVLPGELHAQGQEQQQVRQEGGFACGAQTAQELRAHEAPDGALD